MKNTKLAEEVAALEKQQAGQAAQLDELIQRFKDKLPSIAESWIQDEVTRRIEDHAEQVQALGVEKLKTLKQKVNALITSLPEIVEKETSDKEDWPHYRAPETSGYGQGKNEPFFNKAFRNVISYLGAILDKFGLLAEPKGIDSSWKNIGSDKFRFSVNPGFDALAIEPVKEFDRIQKEYSLLVTKLNAKKEELEKAKAKELWESA